MKTRVPATAGQTLLIIDDEPEICTALATALNERGRHIIVCRDAEAAQFVIERFPITHVLTDIRLTGPFRFEGLDIIDQVKRHSPTASVVVLTGHSTDELQKEARKRGALSVLQKPASIEEIEQFLPHPENDGESMLTILPSIDEILDGGLLATQFQPLVWIEQPKHAVGFEALTRVRTESPLANPEVLFRYAQAKNRVVDLELKGYRRSVEGANPLSLVEEGSTILPLTLQLGSGASDARLVYRPSQRDLLAFAFDRRSSPVIPQDQSAFRDLLRSQSLAPQDHRKRSGAGGLVLQRSRPGGN